MTGPEGASEHPYKEAFRRLLRPVARLLTRMKVAPDALTLTGWTLAVVSAALFGTGHVRSAGAVMLLGGVFDALDGAVARESERMSVFGAFLDSTLDRLSESLVFAGIIYFYASSQSAWVALLAALAMTFSLLTSYARARAEGLGLDCEVGLLERAGRIVILSVAALLNLLTLGLALISLGAALTSAQRVLHVWRESG